MPDRLSPLQHEVLGALKDVAPGWVLTGGAALAGVHLGQRTTRDLDLFWKGEQTLGDRARLVVDALRLRGFEVASLQPGSAFHRLRVSKGGSSVVLDLVADPVPEIEPAIVASIGGVEVRVDTRHEILVNKLCTLIQRSEVRDLFDVQGLVESGGDLERALRDAPRKDGGFSALILAWQLQQLPLESLAAAEGLDPAITRRLVEFRDHLLPILRKGARPE